MECVVALNIILLILTLYVQSVKNRVLIVWVIAYVHLVRKIKFYYLINVNVTFKNILMTKEFVKVNKMEYFGNMNAVRRTEKIIIIKHVWICCPTDLVVVIFVPTYFTILTIYYYYFINHGWFGSFNIPAMLCHIY